MQNSKEEITKDLVKAIDIDTLSSTTGGKLLLESLKEDILSSLASIVEGRSTNTLQEFISLTCDIKSKLDIVKLINKSRDNRKFLEGLLKETEQV